MGCPNSYRNPPASKAGRAKKIKPAGLVIQAGPAKGACRPQKWRRCITVMAGIVCYFMSDLFSADQCKLILHLGTAADCICPAENPAMRGWLAGRHPTPPSRSSRARRTTRTSASPTSRSRGGSWAGNPPSTSPTGWRGPSTGSAAGCPVNSPCP